MEGVPSIVSVVNPTNDLGETSGKEKRARGKKIGLDENVERRKGKIESRENDADGMGDQIKRREKDFEDDTAIREHRQRP